MQEWNLIREKLRGVFDTQLGRAILEKMVLKEFKNNKTIVLEAPDPFTAGWFEKNYLVIAEQVSLKLFNKKFDFEIEVGKTIQSHQKVRDLADKQVKEEKVKRSANPFVFQLNPNFTFDRFMTGPTNDFAFAAAQNVASLPGQTYNPLFIYGDSGVGKTHLMQAIAHKILRDQPQMKVLYVTSEKFTNDFVDFIIRNKRNAQFHEKYRNVDVLILDDIQFFQQKESTLEELFHTFNKLFQEGRQMVFACDRPPRSLTAIEERLRTRFDSGLTVEVKRPDYETRKAILLERADYEHVEVPGTVIDYIAKNIDSDVRGLEGALTKVIAFSNLQHKSVSLDLAKSILRDKIKVDVPKGISIQEIQKAVGRYYNVSTSDMRSNKRMSNIAFPRQVAMYMAKQYTNLSLSEIGNLFGGKAHTTVMRSSQKIDQLIRSKKRIKKEVDDILVSFRGKN